MDGGRLTLTVRWDGRHCTGASVASTRATADALLSGRNADEAAALVPRLFSLCGRAQGHAARLALAAARGDCLAAAPPPPELLREAIGEHLWRLCLDWPRALGGSARMADFRAWRERLRQAAPPGGDAALADALIAALPDLVPAALPEERTDAAVPLLPLLSADDWAPAADAPGFAAQPSWRGAPAETGALARQAGDPQVAAMLATDRRIAARILARLAELRVLAGALIDPAPLAGWCGAASPAPGTGLARVETARGLLLHLIQVNDDRLARYAIVAPTEWNFHPQGAFVGELAGKAAATCETATTLAGYLALALDPCVNYEVKVEHA